MSERSDAAIPDIVAFTAVAQAGSFTRAAESLGTSKSNVGKAVQRLEARLGARLFQRTTRVVRLTEDGETYLQAAQRALEGLHEAEQALAARRAEPIGRVRVDVPSAFGHLLLPTFAALRTKFPKVTFDLSFNDRMSDPVGEGWDIVVRTGDLPSDGDIPVRKLGDLTLGLYASPGYLARGTPIESVSDLSGHDAIVFRGPGGRLRSWSIFESGHVREIVPASTAIFGEGQAFVDATVSGLGIAQIFDKVAEPYVASGLLHHVLPQADVAGRPVHALIPLGHRMPAKTRVVVEYIAERLKRTT